LKCVTGLGTFTTDSQGSTRQGVMTFSEDNESWLDLADFNQAYQIPLTPDMQYSGALTISMGALWLSEAHASGTRMFDWGIGAGSDDIKFQRFDSTNSFSIEHEQADGESRAIGGTIQLATWSHFVAVINGNHSVLYQDGQKVAETFTFRPLTAISRPFASIGRALEGCACQFGDFEADFLRLYNIPFTPAQVKAEYLGQLNVAAFGGNYQGGSAMVTDLAQHLTPTQLSAQLTTSSVVSANHVLIAFIILVALVAIGFGIMSMKTVRKQNQDETTPLLQ